MNQLLAALSEYYPAALEIFEDWTQPFAWALIQQLPTPLALQNAGKRQWEKFRHPPALVAHRHRPRPARTLCTRQRPVRQRRRTHAQSLLATSLVKVLQALEAPLQEYRRRSTEAFTVHPDHDIFGSLPGAGQKLAPRRLSELGRERAVYPAADALCCQAGVSPVSYQSGKLDKARIRRAGAAVLRHTVHLWADCSRQKSPPGRRRTIKANASKATATPVPCAVWANAASRGSGACGRTAKPMIPPATNRASRTTAHG